jgi:hypothetical protein
VAAVGDLLFVAAFLLFFAHLFGPARSARIP